MNYLKPFKKILIIRTSSIGDIIHALPFLISLKKSFPEKEFYWLVKPSYSPLLQKNPFLSGIVYDRFPNLSSLSDLKKGNFEIAFDLQGLLRTAIIPVLAGIPHRWGWKRPKEKVTKFYNVTFWSFSLHMVERYLDWVEFLGGKGCAEFPLPENQEWRRRAKDFFSTYPSPRVLLLPGGGWENKRWPVKKFSILAFLLSQEGFSVFVMWGPGEEILARYIEDKSKGKAIVLPPLDIFGMIEFLREVDIVVGGDTGPLHIAAALGKKVVGLYGPTDYRRNGPYTPFKKVFFSKRKCSPCWKRKCPLTPAPCMEEISVREVREAVEKLSEN